MSRKVMVCTRPADVLILIEHIFMSLSDTTLKALRDGHNDNGKQLLLLYESNRPLPSLLERLKQCFQLYSSGILLVSGFPP